jgi:spermidine synthase
MTICEIDVQVIETSKKYFPQYGAVWSNPKLEVGAFGFDVWRSISFDLVLALQWRWRCLLERAQEHV